MAVATTTFLVNLLCSVVSCEVPLPGPEIMDHETGPSSIFSEVLQLEPIVDTRYGRLKGYIMKTTGNRRIYAFEGIPYAQPPVGYWRFRRAIHKEPWQGVREAMKPGPDCLQLSLPKVLRVQGSEDCLYMNIYTPQIPYIDGDGKQVYFPPFPVIVNFHGGGYYFGSGRELGPSYLLDKDVIFVDFNFRVGVLGFLSTADEESPGNFALTDQAMVIQWVYENIASFGGDSSRITIIGHSSGAACAHLHLIANKTTEYFTSGVSLSGTAFTHWSIKSPQDSKRLTNALATSVNCPIENTKEMVACLRQTNAVELVSAQYQLLEWSPFPITLFSPVIEKPGPNAYLTIKPDAAYAHNQVQRKPWIFSMVAQEGYLGLLYLQSLFVEGILRSRWEELAPVFLDYKYSARNVTEITRKLTNFYFGFRTPKEVSERKISALFGDRFILPGITKAIQAHSNIASTYAYIFGFKGKYSLGDRVGRSPSDWGVGHAEDLYYYFNSSTWYPGFTTEDVDERSMSDIMTSMIANFATTGEPLITQPNKVNVRVWETVNPKDIRFLQLNKEIKMIPQPFKKRLKFWTQLAQSDPRFVNPLYE